MHQHYFTAVYKLIKRLLARSFHDRKNTERVLNVQGGPKKTVPQFYFCDNFRKCTPILTIFFTVRTGHL